LTFRFQPELEARVVSAAEYAGKTIEGFLLDAVETALRPIEMKQLVAAKDVAELEALWQRAAESPQTSARNDPAFEGQG
jgi:uncharacterized protein (DUF1778 family)